MSHYNKICQILLKNALRVSNKPPISINYIYFYFFLFVYFFPAPPPFFFWSKAKLLSLTAIFALLSKYFDEFI